MKKHGALAFILVLVLITGIAAWLHLSTREEVAPGTLQITIQGQTKTVKLSELEYEQISGVRVNGKGESIPVEGLGIALKALLGEQAASCTKVTVVADDSYYAELTAEEVAEDGKACLLLQEDTLRLVVFGDENSKRSITDVVQIIVE